jgi:predicted HTH domain antitoxin
MTLQLELPDEVLGLLGNEPQREVLESVLLHLIQEERMTVAKAGEILGLDRLEAIRWYTSHGYTYPNYDLDEFKTHDLSYAEQD